MRLLVATVCLVALAGTGTLVAAENPFVGTWKLNQEKSHLTGDTVRFASAGPSEIRVSRAGLSYTFKTDGQDRPSVYGRTSAWKQFDDHTWESISKNHGTVLSTNTWKLSADGKTLTFNSKGTKPDGDSFNNTAEYERVSGSGSLIGTWKDKKVQMSSPGVLEFKPYENDGITLALPDFKVTGNAKFDGKDYPVTGPTVPDGTTMALARSGPRSFKMVSKVKSKPLFTDVYTVSADGKTLTDVQKPVGVNEPATLVFEKQ